MRNVVIMGAGKTGRGLIARLASKSGYSITFIDNDIGLVNTLNRVGSFTVSFFGGRRPDEVISEYDAFSLDSAQAKVSIVNAEYIFTSVSQQNLSDVLWTIKDAINNYGIMKHSIRLILAENGICLTQQFREQFTKNELTVCQAIILCTTTEEDYTINLYSEDLDTVPYDADSLGVLCDCYGFFKPTNFENLLKRKLYTYNCINACISYLGEKKGYILLSDAAKDACILKIAKSLSEKLDYVLAQEYNVLLEEQQAFSQRAFAKFLNPDILDSIARNVRDVQRKLSPDERLIAPLNLCIKHHILSEPLILTIAAAIHYAIRIKALTINGEVTSSVDDVVRDICCIRNSELKDAIKKQVFLLDSGSSMQMWCSFKSIE